MIASLYLLFNLDLVIYKLPIHCKMRHVSSFLSYFIRKSLWNYVYVKVLKIIEILLAHLYIFFYYNKVKIIKCRYYRSHTLKFITGFFWLLWPFYSTFRWPHSTKTNPTLNINKMEAKSSSEICITNFWRAKRRCENKVKLLCKNQENSIYATV